MPTGPGYGLRRVVSLGVMLVAAVVVIVLVLPSGGGYRVRVRVLNASQLVKGNQVKIAGKPVGLVERIRLSDDNMAELELSIDDDIAPLHEGSSVIVRATSLSGQANRYVALSPGPNSAPVLPGGSVLPAERATASVDLDLLFNTLDAQTRRGVKEIVSESANTYRGAAKAANAGLETLNPALSQTRQTIAEVLRDQPAFERAIVESAAVVSTVAARDPDLRDGIRAAGQAADAVAAERESLAETLETAPATLRRANTTLLNLRSALGDVRPALREARPLAPRLARLLRTAAPLARRARPVVHTTRAALPDLVKALRGLPAVARSAVPAFRSAARSLEDSAPIVAAARTYAPDLVAGFMNGFGGLVSGNYDANGHYARIAFEGYPYSLNQTGTLVPLPPQDNQLLRYRLHQTARCPGGGTETGPGGAGPWHAPEASYCKPEQAP